MPRISKIRLTGCKYDGLRKEHEDSIYDLSRDGDPDHTLFTLCNGGGKGVMMQLIFQLLLPTTRWGKNDGNKIISMFYDQRNNLHPFTFHVVLEWVLDTIPEKRLITGIAIKAIMKNTKEEEEKTGLSYYLYTYEHDNNGYYTVENLPLYDKRSDETVDIDRFEDFLNDNKRDFIKYSQSSVRRKDGEYYRYLENRGIYRAEWLNLKTMNKAEGGVGDYFIGASDNKSVFDKVILPAISENLRNYTLDDGDNLVNMFKSNLSITKDLPILIQREGDYKELIVEIEPLIQNADSGSRFIDLKDRLIDEGNDIYYILKDEEKIVLETIDKWSKEEKRADEEKRELVFKKDNLFYNQEKRELYNKEKEAETLQILFDEKVNLIEEKKQELLSYEINEMLVYKKETEEKIQIKNIERERLVESLDISDIKARADELDDEIDQEWNKVKKIWINNENQYMGYINYTKMKIEENINKRKKYKDKKDKLKDEIIRFSLKEEDLAKEKMKLEEDYDSMTLMFPERITEDLVKSKENSENEIENLIQQKNICKDQLWNYSNEINRFQYQLNEQEEKQESLKKEIIEKEKHELELARRVSKQLLENYDGSLLNHNWFANKVIKIEYMEERKKKDLENVQRTIWEKNIDKLLNKEDYFIPNKDIVLLKEEIKRLDIHVETGTEYLNSLKEEEKEDILKDYPSFLYSVVIGNERDWDMIHKNMNTNLFLNNMVPIYLRSQMRPKEDIFKVFLGEAYELVNKDNFQFWKDNMEKEFGSLTQTESNIKTDLENIDKIKQELIFMAKSDSAYILNQKLKRLEKTILDIRDKIRRLEEEKLGLDNKYYILENDLKKNADKLDTIKNSIKQIELYIEMVEEINRERTNILKVIKELDEINIEISNIDYDNENKQDSQNSIKDSYNQWKTRIEYIVEDLKPIFKDGIYEAPIDINYANHNIPDFSIGDDILKILISERKAIEEDIRSKNNNILVLDTEIIYLRKELEKNIKDLKKLDKDWINFEELKLSLNEMIIIIGEIKKIIEVFQKEREKTKSALDNIMGSIGTIKKGFEAKEMQIIKDHKRSPIILDIEDIHSEMNIVDRDIDSNIQYLSLCIEEVDKNKDISNKLQLNLTKLKPRYELDFTKGKMDKILKSKIQQNPDLIVDEWLNRSSNIERDIKKTVDEGERYRSIFIRKINDRLEEDKLREQINSTVKEANISNFKNNIISFKSMKNHFEQEILTLSKDKEKAENAMKQWTNRASMHVIRMINALKDMVASMNYTNEQGYIFPLVKLRGADRLPKSEIDLIYLLEEYFVEAISKVLEKGKDIDNIDDHELNDLMGDKTIFSKSLQGRYPTLMVYKMSEKNEFKFAKARDEYYTTWEAINKGEGDLPEGSGGQTLSVNTFVIMMIMSFKKRHIGNENPSTVLILDNPFGKASAKHVLDPIFEIANKLNFQLICFAAPEIIKVEISERFPVFWELKIEDGKVIHGGRIIKIPR